MINEQSRFLALMSDFDRTLQLVDVAYDSAGKSVLQFSKYQDTLEYQVNKLSNTWEQFRVNLIDDSFAKNIVNGLDKVVAAFNGVDLSHLLIGGAAGVLIGKGLALNIIKGIQDGFGTMASVGQKVGKLITDKIYENLNRIPLIARQAAKAAQMEIQAQQTQIAATNAGSKTVNGFTRADGSAIVYRELSEALRGMSLNASNAATVSQRLQNEFGMTATAANRLTNEIQNNSSAVSGQLINYNRMAGEASAATQSNLNYINSMRLLKSVAGGLAQSLMFAGVAGLTTGDTEAGLKTLSTTLMMQATQLGSSFKGIADIFKTARDSGEGFWSSLRKGVVSLSGVSALLNIAVVAAGFAINQLIKLHKNNEILNQSFLKQQAIIEKNKELLENQSKSQKSLSQEEEDKIKNTEELKENYNKLSKNILRTSEEQEKYNELVEKIRSEFPEVVQSYNSITGELVTQNELWDKILEKMSLANKKEKLKSLNYEALLGETEAEVQKRKALFNEEDFADAASNIYNQFSSIKQLLNEGETSQSIVDKLGKTKINNKRYETDFYSLSNAAGIDLNNRNGSDRFVAFLQNNEVAASKTLSALDNLENVMYSTQNVRLANYSTEAIGDILKTNYPEMVDFFEKIGMSLDDAETIAQLQYDGYDVFYQKTLEYFQKQDQIMSIEEERNKEIFDLKKKAILSEAIQTQTGVSKTTADIIAPVAQKQITEQAYQKFYRSTGINTELGKEAGAKKITVASMGEDARQLLTSLSDEQINIKGATAKGREELRLAYAEALKTYYEPELVASIGQEVVANLSKNQIEFLNSLSKFSEEKLTLQESTGLMEAIKDNLGYNTEISNAAEKYAGNFVDEFYAALDGKGKQAGLLSFLPKMSSNDFKDYSKDTVNQLKDSIESSRIYGDKNEFASKLFGMKAETGINPEAFGALSQIAANDLTLIDIFTQKEDIIRNLRELDSSLTASAAENAWTKTVDIFKDFYDLSLATSLEIENLDSYMQSSREKAKTLWDTMSEALTKQGKNGSLPLEQYNKLMKAGMEEYVEETENGFKISTEGLIKELSLRETVLTKLRESGQARELGIQKQLENNLLTKEERDALVEKLRLLRDANVELQKYIETQEAYSISQILEIANALKDSSKELTDAADKANKTYQDSIKKLDELKDKLINAEDALTEATNGTASFKSGLDRLLNSSEKIKTLERQLSNLNKAFEESDGSNLVELGQRIKENYSNQANVITATIESNKKALEETDEQLKQNFGNYVSYYGDTMAVNYDYIKMQDSDEMKKTFEELIKLRGEISEAIFSETEQLNNNQEAWKELGKELRENYIDVQEKILELIKKNADEELKISQDKYKALEEQENQYIESLTKSIEKQRQLRDKQRSYEDLAGKESKLALMQRDTSGSNIVSQKELQKDIDSTKENLMDKEVDTLISNMKELYETQRVARELEIQHIENMIETTNWMSKVNDVMNTITSKEDLIGWFMDYDSSIKDMSVEQVEQYVEEITGYYENTQKYLALAAAKGTEDIKANMDEVFKIVSELGIDTEMARQAVAAGIAIKEETIQKAQEALEEAKQNLIDAQTQSEEYKLAWVEAQEAAAKAGIDSAKIVGQALEELSKKAEEFSIKNAIYAVNAMSKIAGVDLTNDNQVKSFAENNNLIKDGNYLEGLKGAIANAKGVPYTPETEKKVTYSLKAIPRFPGMPQQTINQDFKTEQEAKEKEEYYRTRGYSTSIKQYKKGGKVDYTGLAWVDGTKEEPEAFLNSDDVKNIENLTKAINKPALFNSQKFNELISKNPFESFRNPSMYSPAVSDEKVVNSKVENHINIEVKEIKDNYDVEQMLNIIEKRIYDATRPIGGSIFLK